MDNRTTAITNPDGGAIMTTADTYGIPLSVTDPLGRTTTSVYDSKHNLTSVTDPLGNVTSFTYDSNNFATSKKNPLASVWSMTNNQIGEPIANTDPLNQTETRRYDGNLNPVDDNGFHRCGCFPHLQQKGAPPGVPGRAW